MAELPHPKHLREGLFFDASTVRLDLWRLLTQFLADREFTELVKDEIDEDAGNHRLYSLNEFQEYEATRILISSAIGLRIADDREQGLLAPRAKACGQLQQDVRMEELVDLSLREACNKIVHARRIAWDGEKNGRGHIVLNPRLYLYGERGGVEWRATLEVIDYCRECQWVLQSA